MYLKVLALSLSGVSDVVTASPSTKRWRLAAPPRIEPARVPLITWATAVILSVLFPLAGATLVAVAILDWTLVRRIPALRRAV